MANPKPGLSLDDMVKMYNLPDHAILTHDEITSWIRADAVNYEVTTATQIYYYRKLGFLKGFRAGRHVVYTVGEVKEFVEMLRREKGQKVRIPE